MNKHLLEDLTQIDKLLNNVVNEANRFLSGLNSMPAGQVLPANIDSENLPEDGLGALKTLEYFRQHYSSWISGSTGL